MTKQARDPYRVLVSEIMLQQTQVDRVIQKFNDFIEKFPDFTTLAHGSTAQVITAWQGLGYNRRALALQKLSRAVIADYRSTLPKDTETLLTLPGVGPYTAGAIRVFAFNQPEVLIETNIRSVFIHEFFPARRSFNAGGSAPKIHDNDLLPLIEQTLDHTNPSTWYDALMDYGTHLKKIHGNPSRRSRHHTTQSKFEGSNRQIRGRILKSLTSNQSLTTNQLLAIVDTEPAKVKKSLRQLEKEGFIITKGSKVILAE